MPRNNWGVSLLMGLGTVGIIALLRGWGGFQGLELKTLDGMLQMRPAEPRDERVVIVGVSEADLEYLGTPTLSDQAIADLIQRVRAQNPRVIGLDFYRNLPQEPGSQALTRMLQSTPNLIGIEKVIASATFSAVRGNPVLAAQQRLSASDVLPDADGRVRRGLLFPSTLGAQPLPSLGLRLALQYLATEGIHPDPHSPTLRLAQVHLPPFQADDGGYRHADAGGYQILLNVRNPDTAFRRVSLTEVMQGRIPPRLMSDRLVLIGSTAIGDADVFFTAYGNAPTGTIRPLYGVELHANLASQIVNAVLEGRPPTLRVLSETGEGFLLLSITGLAVCIHAPSSSSWRKLVLFVGLMGMLCASSYIGLLWGWWLPLIPSLTTVAGTCLTIHLYRTHQFKLLSTRDELTRLANRRTLNEALQREWQKGGRSRRPLSLIICDVDYFKRYNDTYGHPQGDECLRQVARALKTALKRHTDLVARYGGEEFVVLLPNTDAATALKVAEAARAQVKALQLEHKGSTVSPYVSLSMGVSSLIPDPDYLPNRLVETADAGLYVAKEQGRDRIVLQLP